MALHITQIDKHKFVCGLFWQALSRPRELAKEAKDLARRIDSDLMVLRIDHTAAQAGFAHSRDGVRKGAYSLAAVISKMLAVEGAYYDGERQPVHNWLGAFKLGDGKWAYFAVRDASFLPNGDFAGSKEEVLERLHSDYGLGGWNVVIGDEELADHGFHNFNARSIESLIPRKKDGSIRIYKWWGLRPVKNTQSWRSAAAVAAVAVAAAGGITYWKHYQREQEVLRQQRAIEAARLQQLGKAGPSDLAPPWSGKPMPPELAKACVDQMRYLAPGGWELASFECTVSTAVHTWNRMDSSVSFLLEQVPDAQIEGSGDKARLVQNLSVGAGSSEALVEVRQLLPQLLSAMQLLRLPFKMSPLPPPPRPPGADAAAPPYWKGYAISITAGGMAPTEMAGVLNHPGVRIEKLVYTAGGWSIEGVMYGK
jgi:hypothetical protein